MSNLFDELRRRNVIRVAIAYLIAAWLVMQVADIVLDIILAPPWVMQVFLLIVSLGLPIVLIISWAYELTPDGLKRESEVDRSQSITGDTGRKLNLITIGMLVAVLVVVGYERAFAPQREATEALTAGAEAAADKSIAVLAFEDLSAAGDQEYFADGLSEELLNVLAKVPDLKVAGRTSSFAFKGQNKDLREIGELLNVAHILEGSVRKSGDRIRVTAQLIKASDGFHLFSETYDRDLSDIFAVQDEIAKSISDAMLSQIVGSDASTITAKTDTETYELYLLARQRINSRGFGEMQEASAMLDRALEIDPIYAPALAQKALVTYLMSDTLGAYGDIPFAEAVPAATKLVDQAVALDGDLAEAHAVKGLILNTESRYDESIDELMLALNLNPTMSDARNWLHQSLQSTGRVDESRLQLEEVVEHDPTFGPAFNNLVSDYLRTNETDLADALIDRVASIVGENDNIRLSRGMIAVMAGRSADAVRDLEIAYQENPNASSLTMWYGFALLGVADLEKLSKVGLPEHRVLAHAAFGDMDKVYEILDAFDLKSTFPPRVLSDIGYMFNHANASKEFIEYLLKHYGTLENLLVSEPMQQGWGTGYAAELANACLQTGDEEMYARIIELMRVNLEEKIGAGSDNWVTRWSRAQYLALIGDTEGALDAMQSTLDGGFRMVGAFDSKVFSGLEGESRFDELRQDLANHVDAERARLGMLPYLPMAERKEASGWQP